MYICTQVFLGILQSRWVVSCYLLLSFLQKALFADFRGQLINAHNSIHLYIPEILNNDGSKSVFHSKSEQRQKTGDLVASCTVLFKILFTQYTCASLWWQLLLNTANLWMQFTLKAAVATHVLDVFTGWFTPSTGLTRVLRIICQKSRNLVRLSHEYILCCDLDYENFDLDPKRVIKYNTRGPFYHHGLTLIPAWISNHMPRKVWAEIAYPFPNFNGCTVEFWLLITNFIPLFIVDPITHPWWD